ncbi:MAG TPA: hypothetical protein VEQ85_10500, partial [Lacipirellulaceae bacterium]|nr:hypothetical protein [Lacipirellulaceae bacterium]
QLKLEGLASNARNLVEGQFGGDQQEFLVNMLATVTPPGRTLTPLDSLRAIDRVFAPPHEEERGAYILQRPLEAIVSPLSMKLAGDLAQWVLRKLDDRQERLAGAQRAAEWLVDHMKRLESDASRLAEGLAAQSAAFVEETRRDTRADGASEQARARMLAYFRMRIDHQAVVASASIARRLLAELKSIGATVAEFGRHLKHLAANLPGGKPAEQGADLHAPLLAALAEHLPALRESIDAELQRQFIDDQGGLFPAIMGNSRVRAQMLVALAKLARGAAEQLASRPDVLNSAFAGIADGLAGLGGGGELPPMLARGGSYRRLTVIPIDSAAAKSPAGRPGSEATILAAPGHDVVTVCEGWGLPLAPLALDLIQNRRDYADFAQRVLTRSDVAWTSLTAPLPTIAFPVVGSDAFGAPGECSPTMTQVLVT